MQFLNPKAMKLKGDEPDFSEEGWARRRPKKK
jgi:ATP-dependent RNA helicase DeaD